VLVVRVLADQDEDRPELRHALDSASSRGREGRDGRRYGQGEK